MKRILLLGSGELGKEFVIAAKRLGQYVIAVDKYKNAPAMQVADTYEVINMMNDQALRLIVAKHKPDIIVPEIESICIKVLFDFEKQGIQVIPCAKAVRIAMNRKELRNLATSIGLKTAKYHYAKTQDDLMRKVSIIGMPCVVKPLMSSSGKGQTVIRSKSDIELAWNNLKLARGNKDNTEMIIEEFIPFDLEFTLLTVTQKQGLDTIFCPPIGHIQIDGDYRESWQPCNITREQITQASEMAKKITTAMGGVGVWGAEFFLHSQTKEIYFSEISPRPHDTGMVTLGNTQTFNEFELHIRAILGLPIQHITLYKFKTLSHVILSDIESDNCDKDCKWIGLEKACSYPNTFIRIFGKPKAWKNRRMGVIITFDDTLENLRERSKQIVDSIKLVKK